MKRLLLLSLLLPALCQAQDPYDANNIPIDKNANKISFTEVVRIDSASKDLIYNRVTDWVTRQFPIAHGTVTMDDKVNGKLIIHASLFGKNIHGLVETPYPLQFNIVIIAKSGRYRYTLTDFTEVNGASGWVPDLISADIYINDPSYKNKKGLYVGTAKAHLEFLEGSALYVIQSLKAAITSKEHYYPISDDF